MEKIINPSHMTEEEADLLQRLFEQSKPSSLVFKRKQPYTVDLPSQAGRGRNTVTIKLKNTVIKRKRERYADEYRYDIMDDKHLLGEGGFSEVYPIKATLSTSPEGLMMKTSKQRVVKIQEHSYATLDKELDDLNREINISRAAEVMHIKQPAFLIEHEKPNFHSFSVMRRMSGKELFNIAFDEREKVKSAFLSTHTRLTLTLNALKSLKALHQRGVIHRDIKLENMFFDEDTKAVTYIDYGLSKFKNVKNLEACGTVGYIAPELYRKEEADEKSDLYALGIALSVIWGAGPQDEANHHRYQKPNFSGIFTTIQTDLTAIEKIKMAEWIHHITNIERSERYTVDRAIDDLKKICKHYVQHHRSRQGSYCPIKARLFHTKSETLETPVEKHHVHFRSVKG